MHVYGYMHVCLGWFWKDQMKRWVCCPLNRGPAPKLASEEACNQVPPSTTRSLLCNFCKFVLARHDDVITLFTDGPLLCPLISLVP